MWERETFGYDVRSGKRGLAHVHVGDGAKRDLRPDSELCLVSSLSRSKKSVLKSQKGTCANRSLPSIALSLDTPLNHSQNSMRNSNTVVGTLSATMRTRSDRATACFQGKVHKGKKEANKEKGRVEAVWKGLRPWSLSHFEKTWWTQEKERAAWRRPDDDDACQK